MASINIQPSTLDLSLYAGDGVEFRLICTDTGDAPVNITGVVAAQIRVDRLSQDPPVVTFATNLVDSATGVIVLSLTGDETQLLIADPSTQKGKFSGVWDVQWTPTGLEPRTLCQGKVDCVADVTR
jgi:hypothetical protein